jgi:hypothetical protein
MGELLVFDFLSDFESTEAENFFCSFLDRGTPYFFLEELYSASEISSFDLEQ